MKPKTDIDRDIEGQEKYESIMTERKYLENSLYNFFYLKQKEKDLKNDILDLEKRIKEEKTYLQAYSYESDAAIVGNGCSTSYKASFELDNLTRQLIDKTERAKNVRYEYQAIDKYTNLSARVSELSVESQILIYSIFRKGMYLKDVAAIEGVSAQLMSRRLDNALKELMKDD